MTLRIHRSRSWWAVRCKTIVDGLNARLGDQCRRLRFGQVHGGPLTGWFHEEAISSQDASIADTQEDVWTLTGHSRRAKSVLNDFGDS